MNRGGRRRGRAVIVRVHLARDVVVPFHGQIQEILRQIGVHGKARQGLAKTHKHLFQFRGKPLEHFVRPLLGGFHKKHRQAALA